MDGAGFSSSVGSSLFGAGGSSADDTMSTVMGSAVTAPKGCTSAKISMMAATDKWPTADAAMPEPMSRGESNLLTHMGPSVPASIAAVPAVTIPFWREVDIVE